MKIPSIHVGCGDFSLQRLGVLIDGNEFNPVACVDIDLKKAKSKLSSIKINKNEYLTDRVYTTISEAKKKHDAKVCFIFVSFKEHHNEGKYQQSIPPNVSYLIQSYLVDMNQLNFCL